MNLMRPTFVQIHLDRLMNNYRRLEGFHPPYGFQCPMIKANGYGHGDVAIAKALEKQGCQFVGVASVEEGLNLRRYHVGLSVLVFGFYGVEAVEEMVAHHLTPVVSSFEQVENLVKLVKTPMDIHLKFNTGMNRLGFRRTEVPLLLNQLSQNLHLRVVGLCTHLHSGENIALHESSSAQQVAEFAKIKQLFQFPIPYLHVYNSAAIYSLYQTQHSFQYGFRPGLLVYGVHPNDGNTLRPLLSPVMEFKSCVVGVQSVKKGEVVSYGGVWRADKDTRIGLVPAGYADGIMRSLSNVGEVLVQGQRCRILGRVCMDYSMIDLSGFESQSQNYIGEEVVFWGQQRGEEITVEEVAQSGQQVTYEVLTGVSERVPRIYGESR